jgi:gliding motility-associated-like protein
MKSKLFLILPLFLFLQNINGQTLDTLTICNGDSAYIYNNWETVTGNYPHSSGITTLIVNPTPTLTGNFILNGTASQPIPNTYALTQAINGQSGSAWNSVTLDLTQPFSFDVDLFFGYNDGGADGIAFLLQQVSTSVGSSGGGIGYQGISPSFCVEFDTWQNGSINSDPWYDHIAIQKNGDLNHASSNNLVTPTGFSPGNINIEDGQWHNVVFSWDPNMNSGILSNFRVVFDGVILVNYNNNIISNIFGNNPSVYWGFTAATGGANNLQQFRVNSLGVQLSDTTICHYDTVQIDPQVNSTNYSYLWTPNYNISNNTLISPYFSPDTTTTYTLEITNSYGCSSIGSFTIFVDTTNVINLTTIPPLCEGDTPINLNFASPIGGSYSGLGVVNNIFTPDVNTIGVNMITYNYISSNGCSDSTTQNISVGVSTSSIINTTVCDSYTWNINGQTYTLSGVYTSISTNASGCTHVDSLVLTINNSTSSSVSVTACNSYTWPINAQSYNSSGIYTSININSSGCTHIDSLVLTLSNSTSTSVSVTVCDSYTWNIDGQTYTSSGVYTSISTNAAGCTHVDSLVLTINNSTSSSVSVSACNSYTWPINAQSYNNSGIYTDVNINASGCIHTDTLNLTISNNSSNTITITACDSYTWNIDGQTYTSSGVYTSISTNASGCTHVDSLFLTLGNSTSASVSVTACDSYTWPNNGQLYNSSGTYVSSSINVSGCNHYDTLNLIINYSTSNTTIATVCDTTYIWSINGQSYNSSGNYIVISTNAAGCTHTEILNLIVGYSDGISVILNDVHISCHGSNDGSIILNPIGGTPPYQYLWYNGSTSQSLNSLYAGTYTFTITDDNGCIFDSVATLNEPNQIFLDFVATSPICRYDESVLSINISNSTSNIYTVSLQDSILKSFIIDTNGLLIPGGIPITLTPNYSGEAIIISLTDNNGCTEIFNDDVHIEVKQLPDIYLNEEDICVGHPSYTLNQATPQGGTYYINDEMNDYFDVENLEPGSYNISYKYTDPITLCYNEIDEIITIRESPVAGLMFSPQPADINNAIIFFRDNSSDFVNSVWDLGDGTIIYDELNFLHTYIDTGTYIIKYFITNQYNCSDSVIENLVINPVCYTYIPSSFTPNDDGDNDYFYPSVIGCNNYNMKIYDRWGGIIYDRDNGKWDGILNNNLVNSGVYSYSITVLDFNDKPFIYTGIITLIK